MILEFNCEQSERAKITASNNKAHASIRVL
jgi:hypothetical protein